MCRGRLFHLSGLWGGPAPQLGEADGVRYTCACFTHSGAVVSAGCRGGEWGLHLFHPVGAGAWSPGGGGGGNGGGGGPDGGGALRLADRGVALGEVTELAPSPVEAEVAVATHDLRLLLVDLRHGILRRCAAAAARRAPGAAAAGPRRRPRPAPSPRALKRARSARAACRRLDAAEFDGGVFDLAWSHDGAWLAYAVSTSATSRTLAPPLSPILSLDR